MAFCFGNWNDRNATFQTSLINSRHHSFHHSFVKARYRLAENVRVRLVWLAFCNMLMNISYNTNKIKTRTHLIKPTSTVSLWNSVLELVSYISCYSRFEYFHEHGFSSCINLRRMAGLYMNAIFICKQGDMCTNKTIYSLELCYVNHFK